MPTYSYKCTQCGNAFDIQQAFSEDSLTECPSCGGPLRKVFGIVGVTFNGPGFYRTDSRKSQASSVPGKPEKHAHKKDKDKAGTAAASQKPAPAASTTSAPAA